MDMSHWEQYAPELVTDLYELTMAGSYFREGMFDEATFSLFIREYPPNRAYFGSAGLEDLIEIITRLRFNDASIKFLDASGRFAPAFLDYLREFSFTGSIRAIPEGRIFFCQEPIVEVTAPIIQGQLLETLIINVIQLETMIATKAARCVHAAQGRGLIDFSLRRTQGVDAGMKAARASYLAGFLGTSNVLAGKVYGIPTFGTMAHSYITSFKHEMDAFLAFINAFPENSVLLVDTYDTLCGAEKAIRVAKLLQAQGRKLSGIRLDSGDMVRLSKKVRIMLREAGFPDVKILASGNLDEFRIQEMLQDGAEIDVFAVGTRMGVSADAPYLDIAYKLVEYGGRPILKLSSGKKTWVGKKQVYRYCDEHGRMKEDQLCLLSEHNFAAEPLLEILVADGKRVRPPESIETVKERFARERESLPSQYREIKPNTTYPVTISNPLREVDQRVVSEREKEEIVKTCRSTSDGS
jgi:nicotinate phosphoribosyltransferase